MGGGRMSRPDFGVVQASPDHPLTEFYRILQAAIDSENLFVLPGAYITFTPPPDRKLYAEEMDECCTVYDTPGPGRSEVFGPGKMRVLYDDLPADRQGTPLALQLTEEGTKLTTAVQLLAPVGLALPPVPACTRALRIQLTTADILAADRDPAALGQRLRSLSEGKKWLYHPKIDRWKATALAAAQRAFDREEARVNRPRGGSVY